MSAECSGWVYRYSPAKNATLLVHLALADVANDLHGYELWIRQTVLAEKCRVTRQTVNTALAWLVDNGLLEVLEHGQGRHKANRYRFLMPVLVPVWPSESVKCADTSSGKVSNQPTFNVISADTLELESVKSADTKPNRDITQATDQNKNTRDRFDDFWSVYPRKAGKGQARKTWRAVLEDGFDPDVIIAGAERYRDDPNRIDKFTAHPSTWLNGERWEDDPLPSSLVGSNPLGSQIDTDRDAPTGLVDWSNV